MGYCRKKLSTQLNKMREKMNTKKILVSLCTIAIALFLVATVSATDVAVTPGVPSTSSLASLGLASSLTVIEVNGINVVNAPSIIAGETMTVKVQFTANVSATNVRVKATVDGDKVSFDAMSAPFDVEAGHTYKQTLSLEVPSELKDVLSDNVALSVKIWNGDYESEYNDLSLRVQRPSYNPVVKSITTSQTIQAGATIPVDVVLKNLGYNDLNDVYVTVGISALGVEKTSYFGDLVTIKDCTNDNCDEKDTVSGRIFLEVPYTAKAGVYTLEVKVTNDDVESTFVRQVVLTNDLSKDVIVSSTSKTVAVGQDAEYSLLLLNPTNSLKVYTIVAESKPGVTLSVKDTVIAVPAGSSMTATVTAQAESEGDYTFDVSVLSGESLVQKVTLDLTAKGKTVNPIVVLTVILAIIFLVLLVVLIVMLGKKPQKSEEFGESYY
jgi:hypothetical protein